MSYTAPVPYASKSSIEGTPGISLGSQWSDLDANNITDGFSAYNNNLNNLSGGCTSLSNSFDSTKTVVDQAVVDLYNLSTDFYPVSRSYAYLSSSYHSLSGNLNASASIWNSFNESRLTVLSSNLDSSGTRWNAFSSSISNLFVNPNLESSPSATFIKSSDGAVWSLSIDNYGVLSSTQIYAPPITPPEPPPPPPPPSTSDYYISLDGNDSNDGMTVNTAFRTFAKANEVLNSLGSQAAGKRVYIRGGIYVTSQNETITTGGYRGVVLSANGTSAGNITWEAYPGETPIIDQSDIPEIISGTPQNSRPCGIYIKASYVTVRGIEIRYSRATGIQVGPFSAPPIIHDVLIDDCNIHDCYGAGINVYNANYVNCENNVVRDCYDYGWAEAGGNSDGIVYNYSPLGGNVVRNNIICRVSDDGIDMDGGGYNNIIENNIVYRCGYDKNGNAYAGGDANGIKAGLGYSDSGHNIVRFNVSFQNRMRGFVTNASSDNKFYHNTSWKNGTFGYVISALADATNTEFVNNISFDENARDGLSYWSGLLANNGNTWNLGISDPLFVSIDPQYNSDGILQNPNFLRLSANSPCVDQGIPLGTGYPPAPTDIGAYQLSSVSVPGSNKLGINIGGTTYWDEGRMFADAMITAYAINTTNVDSNGWPLVSDFTIDVTADKGEMNGTYTLWFDGRATSVQWSVYDDVAQTSTQTQINLTYDSIRNRTTGKAVVTPSNSIQASLRFVGATRNDGSGQNGAKRIQLMRPVSLGSTTSFAETDKFNTNLTNIVQKFQVIRYMDFLATNGNTQTVWSDRTLPNKAFWGREGFGGPWEIVIQHANAMQKDAWINIPAMVNDQYIQNVARTFLYGSDGVNPYTTPQANPVFSPLDPNLKLYVEYSNELWNTQGGFGQSTYNRLSAVAEVQADPSSPLAFDGTTTAEEWVLSYRRMAKRGLEVSNIFRGVFGDAAMMTRVRPIYATQAYSANVGAEGVRLLQGYYNNMEGNFVANPKPPSYYFYGAGGAGYYSPNLTSPSLTIDNIWTSNAMDVNAWRGTAEDIGFVPGVLDVVALGVKSVAYEGGPAFDYVNGNDPAIESVKAAAWSDSRLVSNMVAHHDAWSSFGGETLVYYIAAQGGSRWYQWSFVQSLYNQDTRKIQAINQLNAASRAAVTLGNAVPSTITGREFSFRSQGWGSPSVGSLSMTAGLGNGGNPSWAAYGYHADNGAGTVSISISNATSGAQVSAYWDGILISNRSAVNGTISFGEVNFEQYRLHGLIIKASAGSFSLDSVTLTPVSAPVVETADYYVALYGNDITGDGSITKPFRTFTKANAVLLALGSTTARADKVVMVRGGTYNAATDGTVYGVIDGGVTRYGIRLSAGGTQGHPVIWKPYPGEQVVVDHSAYSGDSVSYRPWNTRPHTININASNITFKDFYVQNSPNTTIFIEGASPGATQYVTVDGCHVSHGFETGIKMWNAQYWTIKNCVITDMFDDNSVQSAGQGGNADGIGVNQSGQVPGYGLIANNVISYCSDDGIDCWGQGSNTIIGNVVHHSGYRYSDGLDLSRNGNPGRNEDGSINGAHADGGGIKFGGSFVDGNLSDGNSTFIQNVAAYCARRGFVSNGSPGCKAYNNTAYNNLQCDWQISVPNDASDLRNNIGFNNDSNLVAWSAPASTNNSWNLSLTPVFVSTNVASADFMKLAAGSPGINRGAVIAGISYLGSAPDLGAYERE